MTAAALDRRLEHLLTGLPPARQAEVLAAVHAEVGQERHRRVEAEALRAVVDAASRETRLADAAAQFLDGVARLIRAHGCALAMREPGGRFRMVASRGFAEPSLPDAESFSTGLTDRLRQLRGPVPLPEWEVRKRGGRGFAPAQVVGWAVPLLLDEEVIGLVTIRRSRIDPFAPEHLRTLQALANAAAVPLSHAQTGEQMRRYAALLDRALAVAQCAFEGAEPATLARAILEGAGQVGQYRGAAFVDVSASGPRVTATLGTLAGAVDRAAPAELAAATVGRLPADRVRQLGATLGLTLADDAILLVPVTTAEQHLATMALVDPDGESPDDRLMEAYASRVALAYHYTLTRTR